MSGGLSRYGITILAILVFAVFVALYWINLTNIYFAILSAQGIPEVVKPFSDLSAVLTAIRCAHQGVNVYQPSVCMSGGVYNYSPLVLKFTFLKILGRHVLLSGVMLDVTFLVALSTLPAPDSVPELCLRAFATVSSATIFALERANFDVIIFLIITVGVLCCLRNPAFKIAGYFCFFAAAAFKYFPITLMILILQESGKKFFLLAGCMVVVGVIFLAYFGHGTLSAIQIIPHAGPLGNDFGAVNIPLGIDLLFVAPGPISIDAIVQYHMPLFFDLIFCILCFLSIALAVFKRKNYSLIICDIEPERYMFLLAGAISIVTCFFIAQNIVYRDIFLLLALPGIFALERIAEGQGRVDLRKLIAAILFIMWEESFRFFVAKIAFHAVGTPFSYAINILFWLFREFVWWWVVIQLMAFTICFVDSRTRSIFGFDVKMSRVPQIRTPA